MLVFFCVCILVLTFLVVPFHIGVSVKLDLFESSGQIKVYLFGIRILKFNVSLGREPKSDDLALRVNGDLKQLPPPEKPKKQKDGKKALLRLIKHPAIQPIRFYLLNAHFEVGKTRDAFTTALLTQALRVLFYASVAPLKSRFNTAISESFTPFYDRDVLKSEVTGIIGISIADSILSCLATLFSRKPKQREVTA